MLRSFSHDSNDHLISQVYTLSGHKVNMTQLYSEPNIGSLVWRLQGPRNGLPGYIAVPGITRPGPPPYNFFVGGWLGSQFAPYCLGGLPAEPDFTVGKKLDDPPAQIEEDLQPQVAGPVSRSAGGAALRPPAAPRFVRPGPAHARQSDAVQSAESQYQNALRLLSTPEVRRAFELADVPAKVREAYGRTKIGGRCLQARRLVEAGARFVMVDYGYDPDYGNIWDNHNAPVQNHPPIQEMCRRGYHLAGMDRAFAALIRDLDERGLLDTTLVCFITEFGRTPQINPAGGRDHWGAAGSLFFAGGGIKAGQVDRRNRPHRQQADHASLRPVGRGRDDLSLLGVNYRGFAYDIQDRPRPILEQGEPIEELI